MGAIVRGQEVGEGVGEGAGDDAGNDAGDDASHDAGAGAMRVDWSVDSMWSHRPAWRAVWAGGCEGREGQVGRKSDRVYVLELREKCNEPSKK